MRVRRLERDDAFDHHRVVELICEAQPCLPVRFGTVFADDLAARQAIVPRVPDLRAALARVSGMSELAITLLWRGEPSAAAAQEPAGNDLGPGRRFMEERRARLAERARERRGADDPVERLGAGVEIAPAIA